MVSLPIAHTSLAAALWAVSLARHDVLIRRGAPYALEVSESLLDCAHAYGFKQAQSLRGARRQTRQDTTED